MERYDTLLVFNSLGTASESRNPEGSALARIRDAYSRRLTMAMMSVLNECGHEVTGYENDGCQVLATSNDLSPSFLESCSKIAAQLACLPPDYIRFVQKQFTRAEAVPTVGDGSGATNDRQHDLVHDTDGECDLMYDTDGGHGHSSDQDGSNGGHGHSSDQDGSAAEAGRYSYAQQPNAQVRTEFNGEVKAGGWIEDTDLPGGRLTFNEYIKHAGMVLEVDDARDAVKQLAPLLQDRVRDGTALRCLLLACCQLSQCLWPRLCSPIKGAKRASDVPS